MQKKPFSATLQMMSDFFYFTSTGMDSKTKIGNNTKRGDS
jgi:hypothetical protein